MTCYVYRSSVREGLYVWLADEAGLETLPEPVRRQLGRPELAMTLELDEHRRLGQEDAREVLDQLESRGFHLQLPRDIEPTLEQIARIARRPTD